MSKSQTQLKPKYAAVTPGVNQDMLRKPEEKQKLLWDKKSGTFLNRKPLSWAKLILFYSIFYTCLAGFFAIHLHFFLATITDERPRYILAESLIGDNPGLGFIPLPLDPDDTASIIIKTKDQSTAQIQIDRITTHLNGYFDSKKLPNGGKNQVHCDFQKSPGRGKVCSVPIESWSPCTKEDSFGYKKNAPCIFLKLNRIYGWTPEVYNDTSDLPEDMPGDLKSHILNLPKENRTQIWIECRGEHPYDVENVGPIRYVSPRGLPAYYFPYLNIKDYLSPLVAIQLERPKNNVLISIECRAWAKNIKYHGGRERTGSVTFEVMVEA